MRIQFQYTKQEYARAYWINSKRSFFPKLWIGGVLYVLCMILGGVMLIIGETFLGIVLFGLVGFLIALLLASRFIIPYYLYKQNVILRSEYSFEFSEEGLHFVAQDVDSKLNWNIYKYALDSPELYLLYLGKNQFSVIPKRIFLSKDQLKDFDALVRKNIKDVQAV